MRYGAHHQQHHRQLRCRKLIFIGNRKITALASHRSSCHKTQTISFQHSIRSKQQRTAQLRAMKNLLSSKQSETILNRKCIAGNAKPSLSSLRTYVECGTQKVSSRRHSISVCIERTARRHRFSFSLRERWWPIE